MADNEYIVGALFFDISEVFDTIDHEVLLKKCSSSLVSWEEWF